MTDVEEALALLTAPCVDHRFYQRVLKALTIVSQCRWAAFCCPTLSNKHLETVAFCDDKQPLPNREYLIKGSPCSAFYEKNYASSHQFCSKDLAIKFPEFGLIDHIYAESYQAEAIINKQGNVIGHILIMDPFPQSQSVRSKEFLRLLSQRISTEYQRTISIDSPDKTYLQLEPKHLKKYIENKSIASQKTAFLRIRVINIAALKQALGLENIKLLFNIIQERLTNNISKRDRFTLTNSHSFIVIMDLNQTSKQINFQEQLNGLGRRLKKILSRNIEVNEKIVKLDIKINGGIILDIESEYLKLIDD